MIDLMDDANFKNFLKNPKFRFYIVALTAQILNLEEDYVNQNLIYMDTEFFKYKEDEKGHIGDVVIAVGDTIINYESNNRYYKTLFEDKIRYLNHIYNTNFAKNSIKPEYKIIQVHINNFKENEIDEVQYKNKANKVISEYIKIQSYSLEEIKEKWYNEFTLSKLEALLLVLKLSPNEDELRKLIKENEEMITVEQNRRMLERLAKSMSEAFDFEAEEKARQRAILEYAKEEAKKEGRKEGKEEGRKEGRQEGRKAEQENIIKNLLKLHIPKDIILKSVNISPEELDKIYLQI